MKENQAESAAAAASAMKERKYNKEYKKNVQRLN
jgi:hypothetical protein